MTGTVDLDATGTHLMIRFPYREDLVEEVRTLPGRRWDKQQKTWRVPVDQAELVYTTFARHLFEFTSEVSSLLAGTLGAGSTDGGKSTTEDQPAPQSPTPDEPGVAVDAMSISSLNERVREALRSQFPETVWVVGEVIDYDKQVGRQHKFFSLIEKSQTSDRPSARVDTVLFERTLASIERKLAAENPEFTLGDGIEIRARVRVDIYPQTGRYQVIVEEIDPLFTLGKMALQREEILRELRTRGLTDKNKSLPLPVPALRIGVLTSPESDGWNDFLRHLEESPVGFAVTLVPIRVQGTELKPTLLAGLQWFAQRTADFDLLCIMRGGGSRTDLAWFDDMEVALAVAQHPLKVLVGIGHQRDQSVLDIIAHSEKTPTAVAEFLSSQVEVARREVAESATRLVRAAAARIDRAHDDLSDAAMVLRQSVTLRMSHERSRLTTTARDVSRGPTWLLDQSRQRLSQTARDLHSSSLRRLDRDRAALQASGARAQHAAERRIEREAARLEQQATRQRLLDPRRVLTRGYALVRNENGRVISDAAAIAADQDLTLQLRDGSVRTRTTSTPPHHD